jgi:hypothetical protein
MPNRVSLGRERRGNRGERKLAGQRPLVVSIASPVEPANSRMRPEYETLGLRGTSFHDEARAQPAQDSPAHGGVRQAVLGARRRDLHESDRMAASTPSPSAWPPCTPGAGSAQASESTRSGASPTASSPRDLGPDGGRARERPTRCAAGYASAPQPDLGARPREEGRVKMDRALASKLWRGLCSCA